MPSFEFDEEKYVVGMFDRGTLGFPKGGIVLKSKRVSPYYHNQRPLLSHKRSLEAAGTMTVAQQIDLIGNTACGYALRFSEIEKPFHHVFGKAQAGTASIAVAAFVAGMSYLWERVPEDRKQGYGVKKPIEGDYEYGDFVHLGDDNVTDGQSKIEGAGVLYQVGLQPVSLTVAFDREEGAEERLGKLGFEMNALTGLSRAIPILRDNGRIGNQQVDEVVAYHESLQADGIATSFSLDA